MGGSALMALRVLSATTSIILRISPFPDFYWIYKNKTVGEVALLPVVTLLVNCAALVMYACVIEDFLPLLTTNAFGICTAVGFIVVFYLHTTDRAYVRKLCCAGLLVIIFLLAYTLLAAVGVTGESRDDEGTTLGWITTTTTVVQFGAPLATMMKVIRTKSNASLPLMMCIMNIVNCSLWTAYSVVKWNPFLLAPNSAGVILGSAQVTLWIIYRVPAGSRVKPSGHNAVDTSGSIAIEFSTPRCNSRQGELGFVELKSPTTV